MLRVYLGHDSRATEREAFAVAEKTARRYGCEVIPLYEDRLRMSGMLTRPTDRRGGIWDMNSDAPASTEFAISRFFVPLLAHSGWCLFADADVLFIEDPHALLEIADESKAVHVVKHPPFDLAATKMDGQVQSTYRRKLWSSVALWNASHIANRRLNLTTLNQWPGRDLHAFAWLADQEIGDLPRKWNHLVDIDAPSEPAAILHFTNGTPNVPGYENCGFADRWRAEARAAA